MNLKDPKSQLNGGAAFLIALLLILPHSLLAHVGGHGTPSKEWKLASKDEVIKADFVKYENSKVWLSDESHRTLAYDLSDFSPIDQKYILDRGKIIQSLNTRGLKESNKEELSNTKIGILLLSSILILFSGLYFIVYKKKSLTLKSGIFGSAVVLFVACSSNSLPGIITPITEVPANDASFMKSIFEKFVGVSTSFDDTYFHVASNGLPDHDMMVGITNWQQQVPIAQNYTGNNSWSIPLKPELAEKPLSTKTNLLKGAIAIAVNGIPLFNPLNNRGEDANLIGELDKWGGHCGRADDYHYHLPPTHLQNTVGASNPIAYAVDGFPVYGETTETLDEYLGKFNSDGSYEYHAISKYPYLIAGMRGKVSLDPNTTAPENQVIPQAMTQPIRPAKNPLAGAEIIAFQANEKNDYTLTYRLNTQNYLVKYSWDDNRKYTFQFISPTGTTTEIYQK